MPELMAAGDVLVGKLVRLPSTTRKKKIRCEYISRLVVEYVRTMTDLEYDTHIGTCPVKLVSSLPIVGARLCP